MLLAELKKMKLGSLKTKAGEMGVSQDAIKAVDDQDDPKQAVIDYILKRAKEQSERVEQAVRKKAKAQAEQVEKAKAQAEQAKLFRAELNEMKLGPLKAKASGMGVPQDVINDVDNQDDPKQVLIGIILAAKRLKEQAEQAFASPDKAAGTVVVMS
jgi:hypothetical protein